MRKYRWRVGLCMLTLLLASACGDDDAGGDGNEEIPDSDPRKPDVMDGAWSTRVVAESDAGLHLQLRFDPTAQRPVLAYYETTGVEMGPCGTSDSVPNRRLWDLVFMHEATAGWQSEVVVQTLSQSAPPGFDLQLAPDGTPTIAAITGMEIDMPPNYYCGANDLGLFRRMSAGRWNEEVAVMTSGEAASGEPASDAGLVVGYWPALAFDGSAPAIAYRDVHFGGIQNDDFERADLELAMGGGGWSALPVNVGVGAGQYNILLFDAEGRPTIVHYNPVMQEMVGRTGLWVTRSDDGGQTWSEVRLFAAPLINRMSAAFDDAGTLRIAYYDPQRGLPVMASLTDDAQFSSAADGWTLETLGDSRYDEGYAPSLAFDSEGTLGMAYYRCARTNVDRGNCSSEEDALVFAYRKPDETDLTYEEVDPGEAIGECGRQPQLIFEGAGEPAIAYSCDGRDGDTLIDQLRFARREAL